jgi:hypothetical protein
MLVRPELGQDGRNALPELELWSTLAPGHSVGSWKRRTDRHPVASARNGFSTRCLSNSHVTE